MGGARRVLMIVNPIAGRGKGRRTAEAARAVLESSGLIVAVRETQKAGDAREFASGARPDADAVVVVGGDGTLNETITGAPDGMPIGLIPCGTANMIARELRIPLKARAAAAAFPTLQPRMMDLPIANGRPFLGCVGVGIDAEVVHRLCSRRRGAIRLTSYVRPTVAALLRFRPPRLRIHADGKDLGEVFSGAIVCNTRNYGAFFSITPTARPDDDLLDLCARRKWGRRHVVSYALRALFKSPARSGAALYVKGRSFRIESESPAHVQLDGDPFGSTPLSVTLQSRRAVMLAPAPDSRTA